MKHLGLIVNPIAGMGGSVGLKGTDGVAAEAARLGAVRHSGDRAQKALSELLPIKDDLCVLCASGEMGEALARKLGFPNVQVVYRSEGETTADDTIHAARAMEGADLLLFAGGDGTARNIYEALGEKTVAIGIPAGVKIHSPVYAIRPEAAGKLALRYLEGKCRRTQEAEVVDIDEAAYRDGRVSTSLYGYLMIPDERDYMQHGKAPSPVSEHAQQESIACDMVERMLPDTYYLIGPGSTTRTLMDEMGLPDTLIGVDLVCNKKIVQMDLSEQEILKRLDEKPTHLILTPTGGQGYLLGRGNQQLSGRVVKKIGKENIHVLATKEKLFHLMGRALLVDTGDEEADRLLCGYTRVIVSYHEEQMCRIATE